MKIIPGDYTYLRLSVRLWRQWLSIRGFRYIIYKTKINFMTIIRKNKMVLILGAIFIAIAIFVMLWGCATAPKYKKDCRGNKHERLSNGIYL